MKDSLVFILFLLISFSSLSTEGLLSTEAEYVRIEHYESSNRYVVFYKDCSSCPIQETTIHPNAKIRINTQESNINTLYENRFQFGAVMGLTIDTVKRNAVIVGVSTVAQ